MMEIHLLNIKHETRSEAEKLLPYIRRCHVYSLEAAACTESKAVVREETWDRVIHIGSQEAYDHVIGWMKAVCKYGPMLDYRIAEYEALREYRVPLWHLERFTDEESKSIKAMHAKAVDLDDLAFNQFLKGEIDDSMENTWRARVLTEEITDIRDKHICQNLKDVERRIRERYPALADRENVYFVTAIGAGHRINSDGLVIESHNLAPEDFALKIARGMRGGLTFEEMHLDLLRSEALIAARFRGFQLEDGFFDSMDEKETVSYLRTKSIIS